MATVINAASVVSAFGEYYQDNGQGEQDIYQVLRETFESMGLFTVIDSDDTILRSSNVQFSEVLQAFQKAFTPKGGVAFTPKEIKLFNVKVDQLFYPDDFKQSWLSFFTGNEGLDRTQWPFVRYFIEQGVLPIIMEDLEKNLYGASYSAPTPGTAGAASAAFDGLKKIINAAITGGTIVPITTGAPSTTATTWAGQVETFCKGIPELYWNKPMNVAMSRALALRYKEGRRVKYNSNYQQVADQMAVQDFEQNQVAGYASFNGKTKILATLKNNAILAMKAGGNRNIVEVEKVDRAVKVYTDFWIGIGFIQDALVFTNDQDLV